MKLLNNLIDAAGMIVFIVLVAMAIYLMGLFFPNHFDKRFLILWGSMCFGYLFPEFLAITGNGNRDVPIFQNMLSVFIAFSVTYFFVY